MALTKISGSVIKDNLSLSGNVSVGGTLTYQDVTNVDALGIGTFRTGIKVLAGQVDIGSNIKLGNAGVITATSFVGSGANLTGITQVGGSTGVDFNDNVKARFGTGNDLEIYHNAVSNILATSNGNIELVAGSEYMAKFIPNGAVELYHNNVKTFATKSGGNTLTGTDSSGNVSLGRFYYKTESGTVRALFDPYAQKFQHYDNTYATFGNNHDLNIFHDGSNSYLVNSTGLLYIRGGGDWLALQAENGENSVICKPNGAVELYYNNVKKFETGNTVNINSNHFEITSGQQLRFDNSNNNRTSEILNTGSSGNSNLDFKTNGSSRILIDNNGNLKISNNTARIRMGSSNQLELYHTGTYGYLNDTSSSGTELRIAGKVVRVMDNDSSHTIAYFSDSSAKFYANNSEKLKTTDTGINVVGEVAASQDYPNLQPTLDLNFAATKKLDSRITYTRSGRASFINEHGLVEIVNSNVPRFDHDPVTRECKGLLIEEERTNLITYSNAPGMSSPNLGGSPQTNDSVSNITLPTGEKGTVRRYLAASGGGGGRWGDYSGTNNTNYTGSVWIRTVSGTGSAIIDINDGGGKTISLTEEWQRVTTTHSTNNTYRFFDIYFSSPVTIYYWGVQIEAGAFMTSYIPTNNATATRGGDRTYIDGQDFLDFYNQTEGTVISSHSILPNIPSNHNLYTYQIAPTGATAYAPLRILDKNSSIANSIAVASVYNNGYSFLTLDTGNPVTVAGRKYVIAVSIKKDDYDAVFDGGDLLSDSSGDLYTADHISIGYYKPSPQAYLNGHIQRLIYYPTKLTNNQLKTITS